MIDAGTHQAVTPPARTTSVRRLLTRGATVGAILLGALALASPAWAGPMMGC